jgi:hypothetical protein
VTDLDPTPPPTRYTCDCGQDFDTEVELLRHHNKALIALIAMLAMPQRQPTTGADR